MEHTPGSGRFPVPAALLLSALLALISALISSTGCSGKRPAGPAGKEADKAASSGPATTAVRAENAEWAWLQQAKKALDAKRAELAARPPQGKAPNQQAQQAQETAALQKEVAARSEELNRRLVDFINANPPSEGEKPTGRILDAIRMKSDEEIALAHQFIEQGGDYRRAIEIYEAALAIDPDNPRLRSELDSARGHRYMTADRFAQVKKGMSQEEVRSLLGPPNLHDVRDFPERGVTAWFYARDSDGRAAAVWFAKENGVPTVYQADFNAVNRPQAPRS